MLHICHYQSTDKQQLASLKTQN